MAFVFSNKAVTYLDAPVSSLASTIILPSGEGVKFPSPSGGDTVPLVLENRVAGTFEIVYMTARTGDQLTVSRGQEGTTPQSWAVNDSISLRATAAVYNQFAALPAAVAQNSTDITNNANAIVANATAIAALQAQVINAIYPVGSLYMSTVSTDPASVLGVGTWAAYAAGRALVGVGNNGETSWTAGLQRGSETHQLTAAEMPSHTHGPGTLKTDNSGSHTHGYTQVYSPAAGGWGDGVGVASRFAQTGAGGNHTHNVTSGVTAATGGDGAHNNVQPSIGIYVWRRTS